MKIAKFLVVIIIIIAVGWINNSSKQRRKEMQAFWEVNNEDRLSSYQWFIEKYPQSKHSDEVRKRIRLLKMEEKAKNEDTIKAYEELLRQYPESKCASYAALRIEYLKRFEKLGAPKTVKIVIGPFEDDLKINRSGVNIRADTRKFFRAAGVKILDTDAEEYDSILQIKAKGSGYGANYIPENYTGSIEYLYTGAGISGQISFQVKDKVIEKNFFGNTKVSSKVYGPSMYKSRKQAPLGRAYKASNFIPQILEILEEVYGPEALVQCFANFFGYREVEKTVISKKELLVEYLLDYVNDNNLIRAKAVVAVLGKIGDPRAVKPLISLLEDKDLYVDRDDMDKKKRGSIYLQMSKNVQKKYALKRETVSTLGAIGDQKAFEVLVKSFNNKKGLVRLDAIAALGDIADPRAVEMLMPLLSHKDGPMRLHAAGALGKIGDRRAFEHLCRMLKEDKDEFVRGAAARGLGYMGDSRAVKFLALALEGDEEDHVWREAAEALARITKKSFLTKWGDIEEESVTQWRKWWKGNKAEYEDLR